MVESVIQKAFLLLLIVASTIHGVESLLQKPFQNLICNNIYRFGVATAAAVCLGPHLSLAEVGPIEIPVPIDQKWSGSLDVKKSLQSSIMCMITIKNADMTIVPRGQDSAIYLTARQPVGFWKNQVTPIKSPPVLTSRTVTTGMKP